VSRFVRAIVDKAVADHWQKPSALEPLTRTQVILDDVKHECARRKFVVQYVDVKMAERETQLIVETCVGGHVQVAKFGAPAYG
jgi:hypothetical protein